MQLKMFSRRWCLYAALAATAVAGLWPASSLAYDRLGTAGVIRSFGGKQCTNDFAAISRGECDPPAVSASLPPAEKTQARVERARALISTFRTQQAIDELNVAVDDDPAATSALLLRARLALSDRPGEARKDISAALDLEPSNPDALATRAWILRGEQDDAALRDVTKAISIQPDNVDALWIRSTIYSRQGNLAGAEQDLGRAIAIEPDYHRTLLSRAQIWLKMGDLPAAARDAEAILATRDDVEARQIRAVAYVNSGKLVEALADLDAVLNAPGRKESVGRAAPRQFVDLAVQRVLVLSRLGRQAEAKRDLASIGSYGGQRAVLQMQLYLRSHGFREIVLDGKQSETFDDALILCFINDVCSHGFTIPG